jgi:hypothetical protein
MDVEISQIKEVEVFLLEKRTGGAFPLFYK